MSIQPRKPRRAFSIIELMVVIGMVMILVSLTLPTLGRSKQAATELKCLVNLREMATQVVFYTNDYEGLFPSWLDKSRTYAGDPSRWSTWSFQIFSTLPRRPWHEYTGWNHLVPAWHCPATQIDWHEEWPENFDSDYVLSGSMYCQSSYLNPGLSPKVSKVRFGGKLQRISTVAFASQKVGVFEHDVWHGWTGSYESGNVEGLAYYDSQRPGSVWFFDGHVEQLHARDALRHVYRYPQWPYQPFGTTAWGLLGRDK